LGFLSSAARVAWVEIQFSSSHPVVISKDDFLFSPAQGFFTVTQTWSHECSAQCSRLTFPAGVDFLLILSFSRLSSAVTSAISGSVF
jgi:hypothetical protein